LSRRTALAVCAGALAVSAIGGVTAAPAPKVTVCHHTGSETNPIVEITISENAVAKHLANHGKTGPDTVLAAGATCSDGPEG
jgi:hypothetical protein